jgi:hypothetical protein
MISFHGTSELNLKKILIKIDINFGGGELGMGFYSGEHLFEAKNWAWNKHKRSKSVLKLEVPDSTIDTLSINLLDYSTANILRSTLRNNNQTRTYTSGHDLIWAPIVGTSKSSSDQYKWESDISENLLNSSSVIKNEI